MDLPVTVILSELLPVFGISATDICAILCTCKDAASREFSPPEFPSLDSLPALCESSQMDYVCAVTRSYIPLVLTRELLCAAILSRQPFTYLKFTYVYKPGVETWRRKQKHIDSVLSRDHRHNICFADEISGADDIFTYAGDAFYKLPRNFRASFGAKSKKLFKKYMIRVTAVTCFCAARKLIYLLSHI